MKTKKKLLCITPNLTLSGAPIALLELLKILAKRDDREIYLLTYGNGALEYSFEAVIGRDHVEILDGLNPTKEFRYKLQHDYDIILLNTAATCTFSFFFQNTDVPVYWWIHEAPSLIEDSFKEFPNPHLLSDNFRLFTSSSGSSELFREHYSYDISDLPVSIPEPDITAITLPFNIPDDRIIFLIPAAYSYIKGQDILFKAIRQLPEEYRQRSFFIFCGYSLEKQLDYKNSLFNASSSFENVLMLEALSQEEVYAIMSKSHCIVAPSRIDTVPLTIVEGMMFNKLVLVSSNTGISHYIRDCVNGFVFNDIDELLKRLLLIINEASSLTGIATKGHLIYEEHFSPSAVSKRCREIGL